MKKSKKTATVRELAQKFNLSRDTVGKLLADLSFTTGPGNAHLYDRRTAERLLASASHTTVEMKQLRLQKLLAEVELAKQKVWDYKETHITLEEHDFFWKHMGAALWRFVQTLELPFPKEVEAGHNLVFEQLAAWRQIGMPKDRIEREERELERARAALTKAIKDGVMRDNWMEVPLEVREAICVKTDEDE